MALEKGTELEGRVTGVAKFGAFVELPGKQVGLVHVSQISNEYITDINQHLKVGDIVKVKVLGKSKGDKYDLSMKQIGEAVPIRHSGPISHHKKDKPIPGTFEDKITSFLKQSEERLLSLKKNIESKQGIRKRKKKIKEAS